MSTVKRRVIWATDEEWEHVQERAKDAGTNVSGLIRALVTLKAYLREESHVNFGAPRPAPKKR